MPSPEQCGVIFDLDGVLVDTREFHFRAFVSLGEMEHYRITEQMFRTIYGWHNADIFPYIYGHALAPSEVQRLAARKEELYREGIRGQVVAMPGVTELVHGLKAAGFHLAIGSSTPRANVDLVLSELRIKDLFQVIIAGEDVTKGKPDPQVFLLAAERLGIPPERCLVVEDAVAGVRAARRTAGMKALAVTTNHSREALSEAHRVVDSFTEVSPQDVLALLGE